MKKNKKLGKKISNLSENDFINHFWERSWTYIKTVVDVVQEPVLILDKNLSVMGASKSFYQVFKVKSADTEKKMVYDLGNGQWNIPTLRKLLEDISLYNTFFTGFEVVHKFPLIGRKMMILNARRIYVKGDDAFPPVILLAIEDVTEMMDIAEMFTHHTGQSKVNNKDRMARLEAYAKRLEGDDLKKKF